MEYATTLKETKHSLTNDSYTVILVTYAIENLFLIHLCFPAASFSIKIYSNNPITIILCNISLAEFLNVFMHTRLQPICHMSSSSCSYKELSIPKSMTS